MTKKEKLQNPSFRELARLGLVLADAAKKHIGDRQAKSHAEYVKADRNFRTAAKAILEGKLWEQPALLGMDEPNPLAEPTE